MVIRCLILLSLSFGPVAYGQFANPVSDPDVAAIAVLSDGDFIVDRVHRGSILFPDPLADRIIEHLTATKRFRPIERTALREMIGEQRFGKALGESYLSTTLDKTIDSMDSMESNGDGYGGILGPRGKIGTTAAVADYKDVLDDYLDLGTLLGAELLVLGSLEKIEYPIENESIPYVDPGLIRSAPEVDARVRVRIVRTDSGDIVDAFSLRARLEVQTFSSDFTHQDQFSIYETLSTTIAARILESAYPSKILSTQPLVISRGSNDGVIPGDQWDIYSLGKEIKEQDGTTIGREKRHRGRVEVVSVDKTFSLVEGIGLSDSSPNFEVGDIAEKYLADERVKQSSEVFDSAKSPSLFRLAVGEVEVLSGTAGREEATVITNSLLSALDQSRVFELIDRQEVTQLLVEQKAGLLAEGKGLASKIGTLVGASHLIYSTLGVFLLEKSTNTLINSSVDYEVFRGVANGNVRIVNTETGVVVRSKHISVEMFLKDAPFLENATRLADAYAERAAIHILNAIYPIKVVHVNNQGVIYLNRGSDGGLQGGQKLTGFSLGVELVDPETGRVLGNDEEVIGTYYVDTVLDNSTKASLISGRLPGKGDLIRVIEDMEAVEPDSDVTPQDQALSILLVDKVKNAYNRGGRESILEETRELLETHFVGDYTLADNADLNELVSQKIHNALINNTNVSDEVAKLISVDRLLVGYISDLYITRKEKYIEYIDKTEVYYSGYIMGTFRMLDVDSGEILQAENIKVSTPADEIDNKASLYNRLQSQFAKSIYRSFSEQKSSSDSKLRLESTPKKKSKINW